MVSDLYDDMERLNSLYERLGWPHTDELTMVIEGDKIVIRNLYQEQRDKDIKVTPCDPHDFL